jgi:hypothetical protein
VAFFRRSKKSDESVGDKRKEHRQDREERAHLVWLSDSIDQLSDPRASSSWRPEEREMQIQAWKRERDVLRERRRRREL